MYVMGNNLVQVIKTLKIFGLVKVPQKCEKFYKFQNCLF